MKKFVSLFLKLKFFFREGSFFDQLRFKKKYREEKLEEKEIKKEEVMSLTTRFFRETKGGTKPEDLSPETYSLIIKNIKSIEKIKTSGAQRMMKKIRNPYS